MEYEAAVRALAPCGLDCSRCLNRVGGSVSAHAAALLQALDGFERHADRFAGFDPAFAAYDGFKQVASRLAQASCNGCRQGECLHQACRVGRCAAKHGVDFCFQCQDFPCRDSGLEGPLAERWKNNNQRMRELGVQGFHRESLGKPRY